MRPHSADLRQRIVTLYEQGEGSIRQLAKRFQVSPDSVRLLVKQYRATGSIAPNLYAGGPQPTLQASHHAVLRELLEADNDATLAQLAERLGERTGVFISGSTISRTLGKLDITRKKVSRRVKSTAQRNSNSAGTTGNAFEMSPLKIWCSWMKRAST